MRNFLLSTIITCSLATTGAAGNLDTPSPEAVTIAPVSVAADDWSGIYAGVVGGVVFGTNVWAEMGGPYAANPGDWSGLPVGISLGYNHQISDRFIVGIEADYSFGEILAEGTGTPDFACTGANICRTSLRDFVTLRARAGVGFENVLVFGTVGYGTAAAEGGIGPFFPGIGQVSGLVWGVGAEYMLSSSWSIKAEYLNVDLGRLELPLLCAFQCYTEIGFQTIRVGLNHQF